MNVYEVELVTAVPGYRVLHHVRAVDEAEALAKVQSHHGPAAVLLPTVALRRACRASEIAEELLKAPLPAVPLNLAKVM